MVSLFAFFLIHDFNGKSRSRDLEFMKTFPRCGSELERTAGDLGSAGLVLVNGPSTVSIR